MKKPLMIGLWIILLAILVLAAAPTTPGTYTANNSIFFYKPQLECAGSTDGDGDTIYYEFYSPPFIDPWYKNVTSGQQTYAAEDNVATSCGHRFYLDLFNTTTAYFVNATVHPGALGTRVRLFTDAGVELASAVCDGAGKCNEFSPNYELENGTYYRIEMDASGAVYQRKKTGGGYPQGAAGGAILMDGSCTQATTGGVPYNILNLTVMATKAYLIQNTTLTSTTNITTSSGNDDIWTCRAYANGEVSSTIGNLTFYYMDFNTSITYDTPALSFDFLDEYNGSELNASFEADFDFTSDDDSAYSYFFSETEENLTYNFTLFPNASVPVTSLVKYASTDYPQRSYYLDEDINGNYTENITLYLVHTDDGSYTTIQVQNVASNPISNVSVVVKRRNFPPDYSSTWSTVMGGVTDDSGSVTFWVNPNAEYQFTFSKATYTTKTVYITPSQESYTVIMELSSQVAEYTAPTQGMLWYVWPPIGIIQRGTAYTFQFNITATQGNLRGCKIEVKNATSDTVANSAVGCNITATYYGENLTTGAYTILENDTLYGVLSIIVDASCDGGECDGGPKEGDSCTDDSDCMVWGIIDYDHYWRDFSYNYANYSTFKDFLYSWNDIDEFGDDTAHNEFSRVVFFFLFVTIIVGFINLATGWEVRSPGYMILVVLGLVIAGSVAGFFEIFTLPTGTSSEVYNALASWLNKYLVMMITILFSGGYLLNSLRRTTLS